MKLNELFLKEDVAESKDLAALVAAFPNNAAKAVQTMWSKNRLTFKGKNFGDVYHAAAEAAEKKSKDCISETEFDIETPNERSSTTFTSELKIEDVQESYGGFDPKQPNCLFIGFDAWANDEEDLNEQFYKWFKRNEGKTFDDEIEEHEKCYNAMWKVWSKSHGACALLFKVTFNDSGNVIKATKVLDDSDTGKSGTFYQTIYKSAAFKELGLVNVRLD